MSKWTEKDAIRQQALLERYLHNNDKDALNDLLTQASGLIAMVIREVSVGKYEMDELINVGRLGMFKAIQKYDPQKGTFSTYAAHFIRGELQHFFRWHRRQRRKYEKRGISFIALPEAVEDEDHHFQPLSEVDPHFERLEMQDEIKKAWEVLTEQQRIVVYGIAVEGKTQEEVSNQIGLSQKHVSRMWLRGLKKLRRALKQETQTKAAGEE